MFGLGTTELVIIVAILVLFFGSKKIAEITRNVAEAVKILRNSLSGSNDEKNK
jgi:sec-independent protein translocase protein TatA